MNHLHISNKVNYILNAPLLPLVIFNKVLDN